MVRSKRGETESDLIDDPSPLIISHFNGSAFPSWKHKEACRAFQMVAHDALACKQTHACSR